LIFQDKYKMDWLNIVLVAISLILAIYLPFELFLFAYAILGPLHYLTEINWLDNKKYFLGKRKSWFLFFVFIAILVSIHPMIKLFDSSWTENNFFELLLKYGPIIVFSCFLFAFGLLFIKVNKLLTPAIVFVCLISFGIYYFIPTPIILAGVFLPTIIHVYLFTFLFILYGARRNSNPIGKINAIALLIIPLIIYCLPLHPANYELSNDAINNYSSSNFHFLNKAIAYLIGESISDIKQIDVVGLKIQVFIAFAYTYHYLNWFSKTSIIGWSKGLNRKRSLIIGVLWIGSVGIYMYDFKLGFTYLIFLSFLHVFMEFPLNVRTIQDLFK